MFSLRNTLREAVQRQSLNALANRFVGDNGIAVSIVCVSRDTDSYLDLFLASLEDQLLPASRFEVLVFDNGSLDDTPDVLRRFAERGTLNLRFESAATPVSQACAWNVLSERARGGVLVFLNDAVLAHPSLLAEHLMAHLEGETLLVGAPVRSVHSHVFPIQLFPPLEVRPSPVVSSQDGGWKAILAPFVCSLPPLPEGEVNWMDFDLGHASLRRETLQRVGPFCDERLGEWGLVAREFALRAQLLGVPTRYLSAPSAWQSLKPGTLTHCAQSEREMNRFFWRYPALERDTTERDLTSRLLPPALPAWQV